jgi:hypothetical protein
MSQMWDFWSPRWYLDIRQGLAGERRLCGGFSMERRNDVGDDPGPIAATILSKNAHGRVPGPIGALE